MNSREAFLKTIQHQEPIRIVVDFGGTSVTGIHVKRECEILSVNGGFVFNTVHNIQANTPVENVVAMVETVRKF